MVPKSHHLRNTARRFIFLYGYVRVSNVTCVRVPVEAVEGIKSLVLVFQGVASFLKWVRGTERGLPEIAVTPLTTKMSLQPGNIPPHICPGPTPDPPKQFSRGSS